MTLACESSDYFTLLPAIIEIYILTKLDFESLLTARATCYRWNQIISKDLLSLRASLQIQIDNSKQCKLFKHGQWKRNIMGSWEEISIHYPMNLKSSIEYYNPLGQNSGFIHFEEVNKIVLYEGGNGSFLDFVHNFMASMPSIEYVHIRESFWTEDTLRYGKWVSGPFWGLHTFTKSWIRGMQNLSKIKTFRICLFERYATMVFLRAVEMAKPPLVTLELDLSKISGLPLYPIELDRTYHLISKLILNSKTTLENLRIKWSHRVEGNSDLLDYSQELDPYIEFLKMLSNNFEDFKSLKLKVLMLNFPIISFFSSVVYEFLVPFILAQEETMERFYLSRIKWEFGIEMFHSKFGPNLQRRFEYGIYMVDMDRWRNRVALIKAVRSIEFHSFTTEHFNLHSINHMRHQTRRHITGWKKSPMGCFKVYNSETNVAFVGINLKEILHCFGHLQELELIDNGSYNYSGYKFSNSEFNNIFTKLHWLKSLKLTNLQDLTDAGVVTMSQKEIDKMKNAGVFYPKPDVRTIPVAQAHCLKYLELRNLSATFSDVAIYLAIQFIPKLEKISFHGRHKITDWGELVLVKRFHRNPLFAVYFQRLNMPYRPCTIDFP